MHKCLKALALASLALVGLAACNGARSTAVDMLDKGSNGRGFVTKTYNGRNYGLFVPISYNPANKYPMIVFLHGVGEGGTNDIAKPLSVGLAPFVADKVKQNGDFDFIVVFPQSADGGWDEKTHGPEVIGIIEHVKQQYSVDADRIGLTGLSTGGYGTWAIGAQNPHVFAALVPMASSAACTDQGPTLAKMNIWAVENAMDPFGGFGANGRSVASVVAAGGKPKHTTYGAFGHNCWDTLYADPEFVTWVRSARRTSSGVPTSIPPAPKPSSSDASPMRTNPAAIPVAATPVSTAKPAPVEANSRAVVPTTPY